MSGTPGADARKRARVISIQRWLLNPPMKLFVWLGLVPGHIVLETRGRRTGRSRRTVVGAHRDDDTVWIVAEQGRHAAWVRNLEVDPCVRVRHRARWNPARAVVLDDDDPRARLATWHRPGHTRLVQAFGTQLTTVQVDLGTRTGPSAGAGAEAEERGAVDQDP